MRESGPGSAPARALLCLLALAGALLLAGCTATAPSGGQGSGPSAGPVTATSSVPSYMVYVPGNDHGVVLLVGRSSCPHCQDTKKLLANLSVGYYWVDLDRLDEANTTQVIGAVSFCGQVNAVPILVINNKPPCIIGYQEDAIRRAFA